MPCRIRPRPVLVGGDLLFQDSHQRDQHPPHQVEAFLEGGMYVGAEDAGATRQSELRLQFVRRSDRNSDKRRNSALFGRAHPSARLSETEFAARTA